MKRALYLGLLFLFFGALGAFGAEASGKTCQDCHQVERDKAHDLACIRCHAGKSPALGKKEAHRGLVFHPASPQNMERACGPCHRREVEVLKSSLHYTLAGEVNLVREAFGLSPVTQATDLPQPSKIRTLDDLVSDLLRRRCLRCHLFYSGDDYAETKRGLGCAACHLVFAGGKMQSHRFVKAPPDGNCLHCHYGNHVGWDYYGLFEHDYPYQFRSPLLEGYPPPRPWGVDFHQLARDVHLKHGMSCLACHKKEGVMGDGHRYTREAEAVKVRCEDCHQVAAPKRPFHHPKVLARARCSACHALWSYQDKGWYLMLQEAPDWDDWTEYLVQGPSEIEEALISYLKTGQARAVMRDKFTGKQRPGVWFLGFGWRRFEEVPLGFDKKGRVAVLRPILGLHLSYVTAEDEVPFDDYVPQVLRKAPEKAYRPYAPHTIGQADTFRSMKVLKMLGLLEELLGGKDACPAP